MNWRYLLGLTSFAVAWWAGYAGQGPLVTNAQGRTITAENWGEEVGFAPDLSALAVPIGAVVGKGNLKSVKDMLAPALQRLVLEYALELKVAAYTPYRPSRRYIQATNDNRGKTRAWDAGRDVDRAGWSGYAGGLPFPKPLRGLQVAYNILSAYGPDDRECYCDVTWASAQGGVEHTEYWRWLSLRVTNRVDLAPTDLLSEFGPERYRSAVRQEILEPFDYKGIGLLYFVPLDPVNLTDSSCSFLLV